MDSSIMKPGILKSESGQQRKVISVVDFDADSETEIAAEISIPKEGGWGWIVVAASFTSMFILDGVFYTFGSIYKDIAKDMQAEESIVTLVNSVAIALYFICGPIVSALINRYGFRSCTMTGSIIISMAYVISSFVTSCITLILFYGAIAGLGSCFIFMSSQLVIGFYFERLRALAMAIAGLGQSFGIMTLSVMNAYLVQCAGWRTTTLIHSGLFGTIYFIGMAYRPLVTFTVEQATEQSRTVIYLPSLSTMSMKLPVGQANGDVIIPSPSERLFKAPSNIQFPTAAEILEHNDEETYYNKESVPGPSSEPPHKYTLTITNPQGTISERQLQQVRSMISKNNLVDKDNNKHVKNILDVKDKEQRLKWWQKCCRWERHVDEARPLYRDDAFYSGKLENLPAYKKSMLDSRSEKSGLEYQLAVSRTVTTADLRETKGIFTIAVRRILATMMNPQLLSRKSFIMLCLTGFLNHLGLLVPYVFLKDRSVKVGIDQTHCTLFVSVIGFSNALGKLLAGFIGCKFNSVIIYSSACIMAGTGMIISNFSFNAYYQYGFCVIFGAATAHISVLRSLVIVDLYGLDNLTNATGILLLFQGFGALLSTPLSSALKSCFGYATSFYVAGGLIVLAGIIITQARRVASKETKAKSKVRLVSRKRSIILTNNKKSEHKSMPAIPESKNDNEARKGRQLSPKIEEKV